LSPGRLENRNPMAALGFRAAPRAADKKPLQNGCASCAKEKGTNGLGGRHLSSLRYPYAGSNLWPGVPRSALRVICGMGWWLARSVTLRLLRHFSSQSRASDRISSGSWRPMAGGVDLVRYRSCPQALGTIRGEKSVPVRLDADPSRMC